MVVVKVEAMEGEVTEVEMGEEVMVVDLEEEVTVEEMTEVAKGVD